MRNSSAVEYTSPVTDSGALGLLAKMPLNKIGLYVEILERDCGGLQPGLRITTLELLLAFLIILLVHSSNSSQSSANSRGVLLRNEFSYGRHVLNIKETQLQFGLINEKHECLSVPTIIMRLLVYITSPLSYLSILGSNDCVIVLIYH